METLAHLIDPTSMLAIKNHVRRNPDITDTIEFIGSEEELGVLGAHMINGSLVEVQRLYKASRIALNNHDSVPDNNLVYCLYLPPFYVYIDTGRKYL